MKNNQGQNKHKAFTIVELVIVIAVIALLASVMIPTFSGLVDIAQESNAKREAKNAYTEYLIENNNSALKVMVYKHSSGRVVALENGGVVNVYETASDFFNAYSITEFEMNSNTLYTTTGEVGSGNSNGKDETPDVTTTTVDVDRETVKETLLSGKYISILGDGISTYAGVSNDSLVRDDLSDNINPYYNIYNMDQNDTYWQKAINYFGMNLCVNNSIAGGKVTQVDVARVEKLATDAGQNPDIILFYMGINDAETGITYDGFSCAYEDAIDGINSKYPDANIICLTLLPYSSQNNIGNATIDQYNKMIKIIAQYMGVTLIDIAENSGITWYNYTDYMLDDGIHPNKEGMDLIADALINGLKELYVDNQ